MTYVIMYFAALVVFLGVDAVWLKTVAGPMFRRQLGAIMLEDPDLKVAGAFYAVYVVGIVYFCAAPNAGSPGAALIDGVILGVLAYGTYEATNLATLKGWTPKLAVVDTAWGAGLTGVAAAAAAALG